MLPCGWELPLGSVLGCRQWRLLVLGVISVLGTMVVVMAIYVLGTAEALSPLMGPPLTALIALFNVPLLTQ